MKNKLLMSLLCATAISSIGFISEGFSASYELKKSGKNATAADINTAIQETIKALVEPRLKAVENDVRALKGTVYSSGTTTPPATGSSSSSSFSSSSAATGHVAAAPAPATGSSAVADYSARAFADAGEKASISRVRKLQTWPTGWRIDSTAKFLENVNDASKTYQLNRLAGDGKGGWTHISGDVKIYASGWIYNKADDSLTNGNNARIHTTNELDFDPAAETITFKKTGNTLDLNTGTFVRKSRVFANGDVVDLENSKFKKANGKERDLINYDKSSGIVQYESKTKGLQEYNSADGSTLRYGLTKKYDTSGKAIYEDGVSEVYERNGKDVTTGKRVLKKGSDGLDYAFDDLTKSLPLLSTGIPGGGSGGGSGSGIYTTSDGKNVTLTNEQITTLKTEQKRLVGFGRGSAIKHTEIDATSPKDTVLTFKDDEIKELTK